MTAEGFGAQIEKLVTDAREQGLSDEEMIKVLVIVSTENPVGLTGCAETPADRFSDTPPAKSLCVPGGRFVSLA
jgi:hypothetical protein